MAQRRLELYGDWLLAKPYSTNKELDRIEKAGLVAPDTVKERHDVADKAMVLEVGPDVQKAKVGDKICFLRFAPLEVEFDDDKFILIRELDIVGKIL